ncbi:hypothetical protein EV122DRAFT_281301 [Schizophyllum commune]
MSLTPNRPTCFRHTLIRPPPSTRHLQRLPLDLRPIPSCVGAVRTTRIGHRAAPYSTHATSTERPGGSAADSGIESEEEEASQFTARHATIVISASPPHQSKDPQKPPYPCLATGVDRAASVDGSPDDDDDDHAGVPTEHQSLIAQPRNCCRDLQKRLSWPIPVYETVQHWVAVEVDKSLRHTISMDKQPSHLITEICNKALSSPSFSFLKKYEDCWPVLGFIEIHLNAMRTRAREEVNQE